MELDLKERNSLVDKANQQLAGELTASGVGDLLQAAQISHIMGTLYAAFNATPNTMSKTRAENMFNLLIEVRRAQKPGQQKTIDEWRKLHDPSASSSSSGVVRPLESVLQPIVGAIARTLEVAGTNALTDTAVIRLGDTSSSNLENKGDANTSGRLRASGRAGAPVEYLMDLGAQGRMLLVNIHDRELRVHQAQIEEMRQLIESRSKAGTLGGLLSKLLQLSTIRNEADASEAYIVPDNAFWLTIVASSMTDLSTEDKHVCSLTASVLAWLSLLSIFDTYGVREAKYKNDTVFSDQLTLLAVLLGSGVEHLDHSELGKSRNRSSSFLDVLRLELITKLRDRVPSDMSFPPTLEKAVTLAVEAERAAVKLVGTDLQPIRPESFLEAFECQTDILLLIYSVRGLEDRFADRALKELGRLAELFVDSGTESMHAASNSRELAHFRSDLLADYDVDIQQITGRADVQSFLRG